VKLRTAPPFCRVRARANARKSYFWLTRVAANHYALRRRRNHTAPKPSWPKPNRGKEATHICILQSSFLLQISVRVFAFCLLG
jgi:hypothetical protein